MKKRFIYLMVATIFNQSDLFSQAFSLQEKAIFTVASSGSLCWGDYNNDGLLDIVISGWGEKGGRTVLYKNNGDGTFAEQTDVYFANVNGSVDWGDYDNDGFIDLLLTGGTGDDPNMKRYTVVYHNNGMGNFSEVKGNNLPGISDGEAKWGDCNNDGRLDILLSGRQRGVFINKGDNIFKQIEVLNIPYGTRCSWIDVDRDGFLDICIDGSFWRNKADDSFRGMQIRGIPQLSFSSFSFADINQDGFPDFVQMGREISGNEFNKVTRIYLNEGGKTFIPSNIDLPQLYKGAVIMGDYDNDGSPDLLISGSNNLNLNKPTVKDGYTGIFKNNGDGLFSKLDSVSLPPLTWTEAAVGDYDNDNDLDILLSGDNGKNNYLALYTNNCGKPNTKPQAPIDLKSENVKDGINLSWGRATDAETKPNSLTYNLRVGTKPGACNVLAPMSSGDGTRLIVNFGNAGYGTSHLIKNLPAGKYYWSVQAIDNTFAGGSWSDESTFTVKRW